MRANGFQTSRQSLQPVEYVGVFQAARGFPRMRKVTVYEVGNGRFYALNGCHMGFIRWVYCRLNSARKSA